MNTPNPLHERGKLHPLLILAAVAVLLFSLVGTAAIMGWLPSSRGDARSNLRDAERTAVAGTIEPTVPVAGTIAPSVVQQVQPTPYNTQLSGQPSGQLSTQPSAQSQMGYSGMQGAT